MGFVHRILMKKQILLLALLIVIAFVLSIYIIPNNRTDAQYDVTPSFSKMADEIFWKPINNIGDVTLDLRCTQPQLTR